MIRSVVTTATTQAASGWRRIAAYAIDYVIIAGYIGLLIGIGVGVQRAMGRELTPPESLRSRLLGQAVSFTTLTLPIVLYYTLFERSPRQGTLGKQLLRLRVTDQAGRRLTFGRSLARSALKFAPWEIAHVALWHTPGWPINPQPRALNWACFAFSLLLAGGYVISLFVGARRTPYDVIAGTQVEHRAEEPA